MWTFVILDAFTFLLYFAVFTVARIDNSIQFEQARRQLNPIQGFALTLILLTSSWFVVRAVTAARVYHLDRLRINLLIAILLGGTFVVLKAIGYAGDAALGHKAMNGGIFGFFGYYYMLTAIHLLHVLFGTALLAVFLIKVRSDRLDGPLIRWIESGAIFWHMVDLLWVFMFPMFFLLKGGQ